MDLDSAIKKVKDIFKLKRVKRFDKLYKFTTENISGYISEFSFKDKTLLTVGSSCDQVINANLYGCNDIVVVDVNGLAEYYFYLKKAAILSFDYDDFLKFLDYNFYGDTYSKSMYCELRGILSILNIKALVFWDYVYNNYDIIQIRYFLFHNLAKETKYIKEFNSYLKSVENYNLAKNRLMSLNVEFINDNILKIDKCCLKNVDNIILSNIYDYNSNFFKLGSFKKGVNNLASILSDDGKMLVAYLYGTNYNNLVNDLVSKNIINNIYMHNMRGIRGIYLNKDIADTAVIYEKKKVIDKR